MVEVQTIVGDQACACESEAGFAPSTPARESGTKTQPRLVRSPQCRQRDLKGERKGSHLKREDEMSLDQAQPL